MPFKPKHVISSFSYPVDQQPLMDEFRKKAFEEEKSQSQIIIELITEYMKKHGAGNPKFTLNHWDKQPEFKAWPTIWEDPPKDFVKQLTKKELGDAFSHIELWFKALKKGWYDE